MRLMMGTTMLLVLGVIHLSCGDSESSACGGGTKTEEKAAALQGESSESSTSTNCQSQVTEASKSENSGESDKDDKDEQTAAEESNSKAYPEPQLTDFPCDISNLPEGLTLAKLKAMGEHQLKHSNGERAFFKEESAEAPPLAWSDTLWKIALCHAKDMCDRNYFSHVSPDNSSPFDRMQSALGDQYSQYLYKAENIALTSEAADFSSLDSLKKIADSHHLAYMTECQCADGCPTQQIGGHRKSILNQLLTHVGIRDWYCPASGQWSNTMNFGQLAIVPLTPKTNSLCVEGFTADAPSPKSYLEQ